MINTENDHVDLRVRRTRKMLWEALLDLMMEKDFKAITVKELCERAMVHRTTFYSHFLDKYDLLEQGIGGMYEQLKALAPAPQEAPQQFAWDTPPKVLIATFHHIAENGAFYHRMLCDPGVHAFQKLLRSYFLDYASVRLQGAGSPAPQVPEQAVLHYTVGAILELVTWWVEESFPYTAEELALYTQRLVAYGVYPALGFDTLPPYAGINTMDVTGQ